MGVFRLEPDKTKLGDPRWKMSVICKTVWVDAKDENEARELTAQQAASSRPPQRYAKIEPSPWYDSSFASCTLDPTKNNIPPKGIVIRADGTPIRQP